MQYNQVSEAQAVDNRQMIVADVSVYKDGEFVKDMRPRRDFFPTGSPMSIAGVHSTIESDFYTLLIFWEGDRVTFRVYHNPLINFVWWGSFLLVIGTLVAAWPDPEPVRVRQARTVPSNRVLAGAGD